MGAGTMTLDKACRLLEIASSATPEQLSAAFRRAAKAAHPDSENGDVVRFRTVIDAYHFMQQQPRQARQGKALVATPCPLPVRTVSEAPPLLVITPLQALHGGTVRLVAAGKRYLVHVPPGIRSGDHVRLESLGKVPVMIRPADGMSVLGGDLFITHPVDNRFIRDGGRIEIETHAGPQAAWLVPDMTEPVRLCFKGLGLPARGNRAAGHLFVKLEGCDDLPSAVHDMRLRFTRVWTDIGTAA